MILSAFAADYMAPALQLEPLKLRSTQTCMIKRLGLLPKTEICGRGKGLRVTSGRIGQLLVYFASFGCSTAEQSRAEFLALWDVVGGEIVRLIESPKAAAEVDVLMIYPATASMQIITRDQQRLSFGRIPGRADPLHRVAQIPGRALDAIAAAWKDCR